MGRIITIQSHVVKGYVGNDIAKLVLFSLGHDALDVNTLQFAQHTGYGRPVGKVYTEEDLQAVFDGMKEAGDDQDIDAIITGYVGGDQLDVIAAFVAHVKTQNTGCLYFCDPVIGDDHCGNYVTDDVKDRIASTLVPLADILTPNKHELSMISGTTLESIEDILLVTSRYVREGKKVLCTSASFQEGMTGMLFQEETGHYFHVEMPLFDINTQTVRGTGDVVTSAFAGNYVTSRSFLDAITRTVNSIHGIVELTSTAENQEAELAVVDGRRLIEEPSDALQFVRAEVPVAEATPSTTTIFKVG